MFKFDYKDESEKPAVRDGIPPWDKLAPGPAHFEVISFSTTDKQGNPLQTQDGRSKVRVSLRITDKTGHCAHLYETWTEKNAHFVMYPLLKAIGRKDLYKKEGIDINRILGLEGECILAENDKPFGGKIKIAEFIEKVVPEKVTNLSENVQDKKNVDDFFDDELPF